MKGYNKNSYEGTKLTEIQFKRSRCLNIVFLNVCGVMECGVMCGLERKWKIKYKKKIIALINNYCIIEKITAKSLALFAAKLTAKRPP